MSKFFVYLLMLFGEILVASLSFILLKDLGSAELLAVNMVVISSVYLLIYSMLFNLFGLVSARDESSTVGVGAMMYGAVLYSVVALGLVVCSYTIIWDIWLYSILQACDLFVLLIFVVISSLSIRNVTQNMNQVQGRKSSLNGIMAQLDNLYMDVKTTQSKSRRVQIVEQIKEQVRFITYSNSPEAMAIELQISNIINDMTFIPCASSDDDKQWGKAVNKCLALIELRKQKM